jgi:hypothetical protein
MRLTTVITALAIAIGYAAPSTSSTLQSSAAQQNTAQAVVVLAVQGMT